MKRLSRTSTSVSFAMWGPIKTAVKDFHKFKFLSRGLKQKFNQIGAVYDTDYLTNPANIDEIKSNIKNRKGLGNIEEVHNLINKLNQTNDENTRENLKHQMQLALKSIPNRTHPDVVNYGDKPKVVESIGYKRDIPQLRDFEDITKKLNVFRTQELGNLTGSKSYYLLKELAEMVNTSHILID